MPRYGLLGSMALGIRPTCCICLFNVSELRITDEVPRCLRRALLKFELTPPTTVLRIWLPQCISYCLCFPFEVVCISVHAFVNSGWIMLVPILCNSLPRICPALTPNFLPIKPPVTSRIPNLMVLPTMVLTVEFNHLSLYCLVHTPLLMSYTFSTMFEVIERIWRSAPVGMNVRALSIACICCLPNEWPNMPWMLNLLPPFEYAQCVR